MNGKKQVDVNKTEVLDDLDLEELENVTEDADLDDVADADAGFGMPDSIYQPTEDTLDDDNPPR